MSGLTRERPHRLPHLPEEQRWLIEQLWGHQAVGIMGGEPKCCKSFLALEMAVAVAAGGLCLGHYPVNTTGTVLLFAAEDALHIVRERLNGICAAQGHGLDQLDIWVITVPILRLDHKDDQMQLAATIAAVKPTLLVLDPFVRLHRIDENQSAEVAPLLAFLRGLQRQYACAVALVHHARKGGAAMRQGQALRGSSELHAWGDSNLYLRRDRTGLRLSIEHRAAQSQSGLRVHLCNNNRGVRLLFGDDQPTSPNEAHEHLNTSTHAATAHERVIEQLRAADGPIKSRPLRASCCIKAATLTRVLADLETQGKVIHSNKGWALGQHSPAMVSPPP